LLLRLTLYQIWFTPHIESVPQQHIQCQKNISEDLADSVALLAKETPRVAKNPPRVRKIRQNELWRTVNGKIPPERSSVPAPNNQNLL